jgi:hypothetical protein
MKIWAVWKKNWKEYKKYNKNPKTQTQAFEHQMPY